MSSNYLTYILVYLYLYSFILFLLCYFFCYKQPIEYSDYKRTVIFYLISKISNFDRYKKLRHFIIAIVFISFIIILIYPISFKKFFIPISLLIASDLILSAIYIPLIKRVIFNVKIKTNPINTKNLFEEKDPREKDFQVNNYKKYNEFFIFAVPLLPYRQQEENILKDIKNFIWILRLYKQGSMKYFSYVVSIVLFQVFFFILLYRLYFVQYLQQSNGLFVFIILFFWMIYTIIKLKSLLGFHYFQHLFSDYQTKIKIEPKLRYLTIYQIGQNTQLPRIYKTIQILQDIRDIKNIIIKNIDYFISFITTVIYIALLTYIVAQN